MENQNVANITVEQDEITIVTVGVQGPPGAAGYGSIDGGTFDDTYTDADLDIDGGTF